MALIEFKLPELGENVRSGKVVRVLVSPGKSVRKDEGVVEVETDKAAIEVPCSVAGVVMDVRVKPGDKVSPGQVLFTIDAQGAPAPAGIKPAGTAEVERPVVPRRALPAAAAPPGRFHSVASPSARRLARELGVDLAAVPTADPAGRVSADEVRSVVSSPPPVVTGIAAACPTSTSGVLPDFSKWGPIERQPMSSVRRATAERMARAWSLVPQVTQTEKADITDLEELRRKRAAAGEKLTVTVFALKALSMALKRFPQFNASVDMAAGEAVLKRYCHIGVAVDTERGLLVPVVRDADKKDLAQLSAEVAAVAAKARGKRLALEDMQGGTFTVTNLGGIGGGHFSPIVNWPEVAILGLGRGAHEAVFKGGALAPRLMLPLSLSYDHRAVDGADAARFLRFLADLFERPGEVS